MLAPTEVSRAIADQTNAAAAAQEGSAQAGLTSDFETFLSLLTAQLSNQDPLKPVDSTEFVSQLASFSAVEQQTRTNSLLEQMVAGQSGGDLSALAGWVGRQVGSSGAVSFDGVTPLSLRLPPAPVAAQSARVDIYDDFGTLIGSQTTAPDAPEFTWEGLLPDGSVAPAGRYRFETVFLNGQDVVDSAPAIHLGEVVELRIDRDAGPVLILGNGDSVPIADVELIS